MRAIWSLAALLVVVTAGCAPSLAAPPRLVASWPTAGATLSVRRQIFELTFNHPLDSSSSGASVWADDGSTMPVDVSVDPNDSRRLKVHLTAPVAGNFDLRWHAVAADSQMATDGDQPFVLRNEAPAPPRIDVSPASVDNKERLELVGKGFAPNSPLVLTIGDDALPLASLSTDGSGKFDLETRAPAAVPYGVQPITATDGTGRVAVGSVTLRYGGWPPVVATDTGAAGPLPGEVTFTVWVRNLSDYVLEHVSVALVDPDGGELTSADDGYTRQGDSVVWVIPTMDRGKIGPFHATYRVGQAAVSHAWIEFRHRRQRGCESDCVPAFISSSEADSQTVVPVG